MVGGDDPRCYFGFTPQRFRQARLVPPLEVHLRTHRALRRPAAPRRRRRRRWSVISCRLAFTFCLLKKIVVGVPATTYRIAECQ